MPTVSHQHAPEDPATTHHARAQAALIEFLRADLSLSFTMLRTAEIDRTDEPAHCEAALAKVRAALGVIRSLEGRIEDRETWAEIHVRADELETALKAFSN
jgi:hypothetical protein